MLYQSHFRGEYVLMNKRGRRRMLLVLLLPWQAFGNIRNRSIGPLVAVIRTVGSAGSRRKRQTIRRRSKIAEEFERAAKTKRTLKQVQNVLDRLHEEVSGQRVVRTTFREYLGDWLMAKKAETASSTMDFYQTSLRKFVQFLGQRADEPIGEITKQDVVAFRHSLVVQVSAKTVNHDLKALKMLFKSARRDSAITDDPTEFVEAVRKERGIKIKRPFSLPELRSVLDLANDEWRSMILFGLYTGQRFGDIATLRWNNLDLARVELRLSTRKTGNSILVSHTAIYGIGSLLALARHINKNDKSVEQHAANVWRRAIASFGVTVLGWRQRITAPGTRLF